MQALVTPKGLLGSVTCHSYTLARAKYLHLAATVARTVAHRPFVHRVRKKSMQRKINKGRAHFKNGFKYTLERPFKGYSEDMLEPVLPD